MLKRVLTLLILAAFLFPLMAQTWGSHELKHAVHSVLEARQAVAALDHQHEAHSHELEAQPLVAHHPIWVGMSDVLTDYLQASASPTAGQGAAKAFSNKQSDKAALAGLEALAFEVNFSPGKRGAVVYEEVQRRFSRQDTYLQTQRFRI